VICESVINGFTVVSNEVEISVSTPFLTTGAIAGSPFEFSVSAPDALVDVPYTTTSAVFNYTNVFTAQLSDGNGSFANPTINWYSSRHGIRYHQCHHTAFYAYWIGL
jgi:hypothetical protein